MLIVLVSLYVFACLTGSRSGTLALGTAFAALLHPVAALTALVIATVAYVAPRDTLTARLYAVIALATIVTKNSLAPDLASSLIGVSFVIFQGYYTFVSPPSSVRAIPSGAAGLLFYPQLLCGPIIAPAAYARAKVRHPSRRKAQYAHCLFAAGMILKIWCSDILAAITVGPESGVLHGLLLIFQLYADFAGWCLMGSAIGLACGIVIPRNFRFPFRRRTSADSWRAWNTSLNRWVRAALPLRAMAPYLGRAGGLIIYCAVLALWHGLFTNFFIYIAFTLFFIWWQARLTSPKLLQVSQVLFFSTMGFAFFGRLPTSALAIPASAIDQLVLAGSVLFLFDAGIIRRVFRHWQTLNRLWWLMPSAIALIFAFRPAAKAFMYTRF